MFRVSRDVLLCERGAGSPSGAGRSCSGPCWGGTFDPAAHRDGVRGWRPPQRSRRRMAAALGPAPPPPPGHLWPRIGPAGRHRRPQNRTHASWAFGPFRGRWGILPAAFPNGYGRPAAGPHRRTSRMSSGGQPSNAAKRLHFPDCRRPQADCRLPPAAANPLRCPVERPVLGGQRGGTVFSLEFFWGRGGGVGEHNPQYANYWAPLTRKRHTMPHPAQPRHTNDWAPRTRKRHQQEHRPQRPTESSDPTQHAKGRTGDCPGPRKGATTRRNVTQGGLCGGGLVPCAPTHPLVLRPRHAVRDTLQAYGPEKMNAGEAPAVRVTVADGPENEDLCIRVTDYGGGLPRSPSYAALARCPLLRATEGPA